MTGLFVRLKELIADQLFARVRMFLWGIPFLVLGGFSIAAFRPASGAEWVGFAALLLLGSMGLVLIGVATLGSPATIDKSTDLMHDGGDIGGILLVLVVVVLAVPLTAGLKFILARRAVNHGDQ